MTLDQISVIRRRFYGFGCAVDDQATGLPLPADVIEGSVLDYSGRLVAQPPELSVVIPRPVSVLRTRRRPANRGFSRH